MIEPQFTTAKAAKAYHKSGRELPCGCRVHGGPSSRNRTPITVCDEAKRLIAERDEICRPGMYGREYDTTAHQAKLAEIQAHYAATPVYLGGK